jgi:hypothetical protein
MGRPLKIQKYSAMSGIFTSGPTAQAVNIDQGYPPFAAPTSLDTATVVLPQPATTPLPFTGVVGGAPVLSQPSTSYPVVRCTVNIALPNGTGQGSAAGRIIRQKGSHKFLVSSNTAVQDESMVVGASYMITTLDTTNWQQMGAPAGATTGTIFTCTAVCADPKNGVGVLVGQCVLKNQATPSVGNMNISVSIADSTPTYLSKLTNKFAQDFFGGATGGNANTGDVWNPAQVNNDIEYAANFFVDGEQFAKSGAETATWAGTNQNSNGTLTMAEVNKVTS